MSSLERTDSQLKDLERYMLYREGRMTIHQLATLEGVQPATIEKSIERGARKYEVHQQRLLRDAKYEGAIANEQIRRDLRTKMADKMAVAIEILLSGKRPIVETKTDGSIEIKEIVDPDVIVKGIEALRKAISLEEKAGPNTFVQIQQTNVAGEGGEIRAGISFEERLDKIRQAQTGTLPAAETESPIIEAEVLNPDKPEPEVGETEALF